MQHSPAEQEKDNNTTPEDPLILLCTSLDHADGISADAECIRHVIQSALRTFEDFALLTQVR